MKFKATLSERGVSLLERRFVPAFEKIGKTCHIYLTRGELVLLHNVLSTDGVQAIAQLPKEVLFEDFRIVSQNDDRIAFMIDLGLLGRALRSSRSMEGEHLQVKLVKKCPGPSERALPYLTFESKGHSSAVVHDVPISQPLSRSEVEDLQAAVDLVQELPRTLVQLPELVQLQTLVERLRTIGEVLEVAVSQPGALTLRMQTPQVAAGTEFRKLRLWGARGATDAPAVDESLTAAARLEKALEQGQASAVQVSMKHFAKSLHCHLTKPDASYCGVAPNNACLLMMFQYAESSISLQYRLPVLDQTEA